MLDGASKNGKCGLIAGTVFLVLHEYESGGVF